MGSADGTSKEARRDLYLRDWYYVCNFPLFKSLSLGEEHDSDQYAQYRICAVTGYRVYVTSVITDPSRANRADCDLGVLTTLEALLGIITACLPMARPVASKCWKSLSNSTRSKILAKTAAVGSIIPWLSLPPMDHGSRSWDWFPSRSQEEYGQHKDDQGGKLTDVENESENEKEVNSVAGREHYRSYLIV